MSDDLPPIDTCTRCGYESRWTIRGGLCIDCREELADTLALRLADERAGLGQAAR